MVTLDSVEITSYDIENLVIHWTVGTTDEDISSYSVTLYRANSPSPELSEYEIVASGISLEDYFYTDSTITGLYDIQRDWYYLLKVTEGNNDSIQPRKPAYRKKISDSYVIKEVVRRKNIVLNSKSGRDLKVLKRRTWGTHCSQCWDAILGRATQERCNTCFGTGWNGGFFSPINIKGSISASPKIHQIQVYGSWSPSDVIMYTTNFPPLSPRDIIIDDVNKRWIVTQVRPIQHKGFTIEQQVQMSVLQADDVSYEYEV